LYEPDKREYGLTSVLLRVDEQRQWSADFGYEDSGSRITSEDRLIAGVTWGKAFGLEDNQFRYAFTFDPSFDLLRVHSASYYLPLPWRHGLRLSGYYLDVKGDLGGGSTLSGSAYQASLRYEVPLPTIGKFQHEASVGLDFKSSENNLFFNEVSFVNTPTEIFQVAAGYSAVLPDHFGQTSFGIQGYYSPGGVTEKNTDVAFNLSRPLAKASYLYGRVNLERVTHLPADFSWIIRGIVQVADGNLLPSEQLGMGGYSSARGYEEREGNGDQGYFLSNELRTPAIYPSRLFTKKAAFEDKLQFLGFWDYGSVENVNLLSAEKPHYFFSSVGPGLRYTFSRHFSLRFDYGWQLLNTGLNSVPGQHSRAHLGVVATY
jgi:hemolysin activation/secretion protein